MTKNHNGHELDPAQNTRSGRSLRGHNDLTRRMYTSTREFIRAKRFDEQPRIWPSSAVVAHLSEYDHPARRHPLALCAGPP